MDQVALEGREVMVTTRIRDGLIGCSRDILIVDRASSKVVGHTVSNSENAEAVAEAITNVCEAQGVPVMLLTDNGGAITSRKIAGGLHPRYRGQRSSARWIWSRPLNASRKVASCGMSRPFSAASSRWLSTSGWSFPKAA